MAGQVVIDWRRQVVMNRQRREHFCQPEHTEAGACQKTGQVFVGDLVSNTKTVVSLCLHCSPLVSQPVKGIESDGLDGKAGDGTRTRDSLLGRQELYRLSYSRAKSIGRFTPSLFLGVRATQVGVRGLEPRTSWSQTMRATNCATPRYPGLLCGAPGACAL